MRSISSAFKPVKADKLNIDKNPIAIFMAFKSLNTELKIIENILNTRGEKTIKQSRLDLVRNFERSLSISTPMGRLSANIISFISFFVTSKPNQTNF